MQLTEEMVANLRGLLRPLTQARQIPTPTGGLVEGYSLDQKQLDDLVDSLLAPGGRAPAVWDRMRLDVVDERIWLRQVRCGTIATPEQWEVYDMDGTHAGNSAFPSGHRLLAVRSGRIVTAYRDSMDVEHLAAWSSF
jgi:hypothetical protein